jgi:DNA-binding MarR family transcriptional regulator
MFDGGLTVDAECLRAMLGNAASDSTRRLSRSFTFGLYVLASLPGDGSSVGVAELARYIGEPISTVHRYLQTLVLAELVQYEAKTHKYSLASGLDISAGVEKSE